MTAADPKSDPWWGCLPGCAFLAAGLLLPNLVFIGLVWVYKNPSIPRAVQVGAGVLLALILILGIAPLFLRGRGIRRNDGFGRGPDFDDGDGA